MPDYDIPCLAYNILRSKCSRNQYVSQYHDILWPAYNTQLFILWYLILKLLSSNYVHLYMIPRDELITSRIQHQDIPRPNYSKRQLFHNNIITFYGQIYDTPYLAYVFPRPNYSRKWYFSRIYYDILRPNYDGLCPSLRYFFPKYCRANLFHLLINDIIHVGTCLDARLQPPQCARAPIQAHVSRAHADIRAAQGQVANPFPIFIQCMLCMDFDTRIGRSTTQDEGDPMAACDPSIWSNGWEHSPTWFTWFSLIQAWLSARSRLIDDQKLIYSQTLIESYMTLIWIRFGSLDS